VNPSRAKSETGGRYLKSSTTKMTMTKEKVVSSSCGRKAANSRGYSPRTSILVNLGELKAGFLFNYEKQSKTQEDCDRAFNS